MKVHELIKHLETFDQELTVLYAFHSDWAPMETGDVCVCEGVSQDWYIMRPHPTMSAESRAAKQLYLVFPGN